MRAIVASQLSALYDRGFSCLFRVAVGSFTEDFFSFEKDVTAFRDYSFVTTALLTADLLFYYPMISLYGREN
jgi:hypothetical protein